MAEKLTKKAVFPVAGLGTRFLPATKAYPKEMLPIVDKPLIQYAVEEAIVAGFTEMIFITNADKHAIENHFVRNYALEAKLAVRKDEELLSIIRDIIPQGVSCIFLHQPEPMGLGDAILRAQTAIGDEPFAVLLADDLFACPEKNCLQQMLTLYEKLGDVNIVAVEEIQPEEFHKYGMIGIEESFDHYHMISKIVEKPLPDETPSSLGVAGRYILSPRIFSHLKKINFESGKEIQLTDAIQSLMQEETVYAYEFSGKRYDCGSKLGYLKAMVFFALKHEELGDAFQAYLREEVEKKYGLWEQSRS
jgi:UTP--glucose-1-phosphate uridylyltransferase